MSTGVVVRISRGNNPITAWLILLVICHSSCAHGGTYRFDIPEFLGNSSTQKIADLDLGLSFYRIDQMILQLTGTQQLGSYRDLNIPGVFPLPANVYASFPYEIVPDDTQSAIASGILTTVNGPIDFGDEFGVSLFRGSLDAAHESWLDGTGEMSLSVFTPFLIATTYGVVPPQVSIDSATLVIEGQANLSGDFTADGIVDNADLNWLLGVWGDPNPPPCWNCWPEFHGNGELNALLGDWGIGTPNWRPRSALAIPEPAAAVLLLAYGGVVAGRRR